MNNNVGSCPITSEATLAESMFHFCAALLAGVCAHGSKAGGLPRAERARLKYHLS